jgi:hypothetical protein
VARRHPIALAIKQHASEQTWLPSFSAIVAPGDVAGKLRLDRIPQRLIDNRLMFARIRSFVVNAWVAGSSLRLSTISSSRFFGRDDDAD